MSASEADRHAGLKLARQKAAAAPWLRSSLPGWIRTFLDAHETQPVSVPVTAGARPPLKVPDTVDPANEFRGSVLSDA